MAEERKISVCVPTYNRAKMLPAAIESVLPQLGAEDELVVLDNHSTDGTEEVLRGYRDGRMRVIRNEKTVGMYENHNLCVEAARGRWMVFLHSDDTLTGEALAVLRRYACEWPETAFFHPAENPHRSIMTGKAMEMTGAEGVTMFLRWQCGQPTGKMYRRERLARTPFPTIYTADLMVLGRMLRDGGRMLLIPEETVRIGRHESQAQHAWQRTGQTVRDFAVTFNEFVDYPGVMEALGKNLGGWTDREIAHCLMFLAHAGRRAVIDRLEEGLAGRRGYRSEQAYQHVRIYRMVGLRGLRAVFNVIKPMLGLMRR